MNRNYYLLILLIAAAFFACSDMGDKVVDNGDDPPDTTLSYSSDIQPIFNARCAGGCHIGGSQGGLSLNNYNTLSQGGDSGPVIVPGFPDSSFIIMRSNGIPSIMPPIGDPLRSGQIDTISQWVAEGALNN